MKKIIILLTITFSISCAYLHSQEWNWNWVNSIISQNPPVGSGPAHVICGFDNSYYLVAAYANSLVLPDTAFYHINSNQYNYLCRTIIKYSPFGEFQNTLDMHAIPAGMLPDMDVGVDDQLNQYISLAFSAGFSIQDSLFEPYFPQNPNTLDGLALKISPESEIVWAKYIGGTGHDDVFNNVVSASGDVYMNTMHDAGGSAMLVNFFDQDTITSADQFSTVCKLDKDGNLKWLLDFYGHILGYYLEMQDNGKLLWWGHASTDIIINGDTTHKPATPDYYDYPFVATITVDGYVEDIRFVSFPGVYITNYVMSATGEKYITAIAHDTVVIFGDTTFIPDGTYYKMIGKLNSQFDLVWYHIIPRTNSSQSLGVINITLDEENLIFSIATDDNLQIADTTVAIPNGFEGFFGEFDPDGNLLYIKHTESDNTNYPLRLVLDNCKNPVIGGSFIGTTIIGDDTITSASPDREDIYIAKLGRQEAMNNILGPDTLVCEGLTLYGPGEYLYYIWNDSLTIQNWFWVSYSDTITFACADEAGCWLYDTIAVDVSPAFAVDLVADTSIYQIDSIEFSIPEGYESYLWSNNDTSNSITLSGENYEPGTVVKVWVQVSDGPCIISDTVYVTIMNSSGIEGGLDKFIEIYPNPVNDELKLVFMTTIETIEIFDVNGRIISKLNPSKLKRDQLRINMTEFETGEYILRIRSNKYVMLRKIIKK